MVKLGRLFVLLVLVSIGIQAHSQELPEWLKKTTLSGLVFGDAYWVAGDHNETLEGENGFWIRRVFLTFDQRLSEHLSARLRFEANSVGDFVSSGQIEPFVKEAWVRWSGKSQNLILGLQPVPTYEVVDKAWGYRALEKTALDLQRFGPTRDAGIGASGRLDAANHWRYHALLGNGTGAPNENDEGKKAYLALGYFPSDQWQFEVYGAFDNRPGDTNRTTFQFFLGYQGSWGRVGALAGHQTRDAGSTRTNLDVASIWGVRKLSDQLNLIVRFDKMFDPNPEAGRIPFFTFDPRAKSSLAIVGVDYKLEKSLSLIPNLEYVFYDEVSGSPALDDDLFVRLTFFWQF